MIMPGGGDGLQNSGWGAVGAVIAAVVIGALRWIRPMSGHRLTDAANVGAKAAVDLLRAEVERLSRRVQELENQRDSDRAHIDRLESAMRSAGLPIPRSA